MHRWVNSITVSTRGDSGITCPLHSGQWFPHPAPDPVARTSAPHRITSTLYPTTPHAYCTNALDVRLTIIAAAVAMPSFYSAKAAASQSRMWQPPLLPVSQLLSPLRSPLHCLDQRHPQPTLFQLQNAIDGASCRSRHRILQQRRMIPCLEHHARRTQRRMRCQRRGHISRQPDIHTRLGKRFNDDVNKRWSRAGEPRHRAHMLLIADDRPSSRLEDLLRHTP